MNHKRPDEYVTAEELRDYREGTINAPDGPDWGSLDVARLVATLEREIRFNMDAEQKIEELSDQIVRQAQSPELSAAFAAVRPNKLVVWLREVVAMASHSDPEGFSACGDPFCAEARENLRVVELALRGWGIAR